MATNKHYLVQSFEPSQTITNEVHTVLDGKFLLDFIPDQLIRVSITGYTQIPWNNAITSATQFKVNYQNGEVQVHSSKEGVSITVTSYGAKGIIKYYADRIVLDNGETIQNKVSSLSSVIESIETADSNAQIGVYPLIASGTNTYTTSYTGLTYYDGLKISLTISDIQKNTGASTLNINSLGDRYIKYYDGNGNKQSLTGGELVGKVLLEYDGSEFLIVSNNAYLNAIKSELDAHKAESMTHGISVSRDISLAGVQTISLPFKAKSIIVFSSVGNSKLASWGFWAENSFQRSQAMRGDTGNILAHGEAIRIDVDVSNNARGTIQNINETGFEINWAKTGSPTGTVAMYIIAHTHGGA